MDRTMHAKSTLMMALMAMVVMVVAAAGPAAADDDPWRLRLGPVAATTTGVGHTDVVYGYGLGVEYRLSPRLGLELGALTAEPRGSEEVEIFSDVELRFESSFRMTPVMAKLDLHLTPNARADLRIAPIAAYVRMDEMTLKVTAEAGGEKVSIEEHIDVESQLAWGVEIGLDVPLGRRGSFLSLSGTYLRMPLSVRDDAGFSSAGNVDPLLVQLGYGVRF